jgi:hypothetical protein
LILSTAAMQKKIVYWLRYFFYLLLITCICGVFLIHVFEYNRLKKLYSADFMQPDSAAIAVHKTQISRNRPFAEHPKGRIIKHYNNHGFIRNDSTLLEAKPGIKRILITGDSHTDGMVSTVENFCTLLEDSLLKLKQPVEILNAGTGNYSFVNYEGLIQHYLYLKPSEYVVMIYTGNDFVENMMYEYHWYNPVQSLRQFRARLGWRYQYPMMYNNQSLAQVLYFTLYPNQKELSVAKTFNALHFIDSVCKKNGIAFTVGLIPADFDLDLMYQKRIQQAYGFSDADLKINRWFARSVTDFCRQNSIPVYDLYDGMLQVKDTLYFPKDHHLNVKGNRVVADLMLPHFLK